MRVGLQGGRTRRGDSYSVLCALVYTREGYERTCPAPHLTVRILVHTCLPEHPRSDNFRDVVDGPVKHCWNNRFDMALFLVDEGRGRGTVCGPVPVPVPVLCLRALDHWLGAMPVVCPLSVCRSVRYLFPGRRREPRLLRGQMGQGQVDCVGHCRGPFEIKCAGGSRVGGRGEEVESLGASVIGYA